MKITPGHTLFFDLDDTLVETNRANFLAYQTAIRSITHTDFNVPYDPRKRFNRKLIRQLVPNIDQHLFQTIIKFKEQKFEPAATKLNTHLATILQKYSKTNQTVLVTNCNENRAQAVLTHHRLLAYFSDLIFNRPGIDPEGNKYRHAIHTLGISPESIILFEHNIQDIASALEAGIQHINPEISA